MKIKVKKLDSKAVMPYKTYSEDFAYDVVATSKEEVAPGVVKYGIGLAFQIDVPKTRLNLCLSLRPRSSVWKTGMILSNCEGTIDQLYRGEVSAVFYRINNTLQPYNVGDRIGQIYLSITEPMEFIEVDELTATERGDGGYGSTGK